MKITIKDIAKSAGVSITTVSKIINHKDEDISQVTREKVLQIMNELNYVPNTVARSLVTKKTKTIGLVIPDIRNPFFPELVRGAEDKANKEGYNIIFCNTDDVFEKEEKYVNMLIEKMVDGIIFTISARRTGGFENLKNRKTPIILIDREVDLEGVRGKITVDNYFGVYEGMKYLLSCGYKRIAYLSGPLANQVSMDRVKGYKNALKDFHIDYKEEFVLEGDYNSEWGHEGVKTLLKNKVDFDSIFCGNDLIALGAIKSLKEEGITIPQDVGIIGFDDIYMSKFMDPDLTTIRQPKYEMGYKAAEMLMNILEKKEEEYKHEVLKPELIVRNSTRRK